MKKSLFIGLAGLVLLGYAMQGNAQTGPRDSDTVKKEIGEAANAIFQSLEKMDVEALFQSYSDSSGFILVNTGGSLSNYQSAKSEHAQWFKSFSSIKVSKNKDEFRFLPGADVLYTWQGKFEMVPKTGESLKIDKFGITFLFRKIDSHWKVIYQHSSSLPPSRQKP